MTQAGQKRRDNNSHRAGMNEEKRHLKGYKTKGKIQIIKCNVNAKAYEYVEARKVCTYVCIQPGVSSLQAKIQFRATRQHRIANPDAIYLQCAQRNSLILTVMLYFFKLSFS